ncbi:hypothetical protein L9W92_15085 [Pelotomaculum terephthalicicum JT]|uniref:hypothetical protein n=1 Tax=Pelotomaculum TaxID=191373 RepID=UPI0009CB9D7B|nr:MULTISPECIES: hypothetical protein [Pelotomaculum]MCG9969341.1 hypothetical protein [Pelotomaculum terephthalicicum JT]OPX86407.1 MAG: hypothetical protein A4E54_02009 [Pelotomaculum sp. PtaB.Bin117]OPY62132.1 MAG: hypothetical protein A4E56_01555 [Pelotomaculum sp. PtaU1.Bin065]
MFSYRTIAGIGAATLALLILSRANKHLRRGTCDFAGNYARNTAGRVEGIIRRRKIKNLDITNDVI